MPAPFPGMEDWHTLTLFQWKDTPAPQALTLDAAALGDFLRPEGRYTVADFQSGRVWQDVRLGDRLELGIRPPHSALHLRITANSPPCPPSSGWTATFHGPGSCPAGTGRTACWPSPSPGGGMSPST